MELILKDLTYKGIKYNDYLNNVNYTFLNGITFLSGIDIISLKSILFMEEKSISGYIMVSEEATRSSLSVVSMNEPFVKNTFLELGRSTEYGVSNEESRQNYHKRLVWIWTL